MNYKQGTPRNQLYLFNTCLDKIIEENNKVRVIDLFVDKLDIKEMDFKIPALRTGAPPYRPKLLLKIYIYGYFERIRSSRNLEKETKRNKELIWLTRGLTPDFKTIANFRKNNKKGIKNIFKEFLNFCHSVNLLSLETVAIDGTKMRAQNNLNNVYKRDEIDRVREKIQDKIDEYLEQLDAQDEKEAGDLKIDNDEVKNVVEKLKKLKKHQGKVEKIKEILNEDKDLKTYFATDPDSRFQSDKGKVRAGYNPQIVGDDKNKLIIANDVTNESNDLKQMTPMIDKVKEVKNELGIETETKAVMDTGYFSEKEIVNNIDDETVDIIVPDKGYSEKKKNKNDSKTEKVPAKGYEIKDFEYDRVNDEYICPEKKRLKKTHMNPGTEKSGRKVFEYQCYDCENCDVISKCTNNMRGRSIKISVNHEFIENYKSEMKTDVKKKLIEKRKEIVEHPFGTIKRNLGYTYFMQKGIENVKTEFSFICFIYNLKRVFNLLTVKELMEKLPKWSNDRYMLNICPCY